MFLNYKEYEPLPINAFEVFTVVVIGNCLWFGLKKKVNIKSKIFKTECLSYLSVHIFAQCTTVRLRYSRTYLHITGSSNKLSMGIIIEI